MSVVYKTSEIGQNSTDFKQKESNLTKILDFCMLWAKTPEPMSGSSMILCKCAHLLMTMSKNQSSFVHGRKEQFESFSL